MQFLVVDHVFVELTVHVLFFGLADGNSVLRMAVEHTRNHLRDDVTPFVLALQRQEEFLDGVENRAEVVLRILEEAEEEFSGAVACAAAHAGHGTVEVIDVVDDGLDRVGESELLVVVTVETELLVLHDAFVAGEFLIDVFLVEGAEAVDEVKHVGLAFFVDLVEGFVKFRTAVAAHSHDVERRFVAHVVEGVHHADTLVNVLDVASHAEHLVRAFGGGLHGVHVDAAHVSHHGHLHLGIDAVLDLPEQIVIAELPRAVFLRVEEFRGVLVTHFHVVYAGCCEKGVQSTHEFKRKIVLVDETAIADRAVENFNCFVVHVCVSGYWFKVVCDVILSDEIAKNPVVFHLHRKHRF